MVEINNWIKKQLKKGYKKEQIKEGLRKANYPQNIVDSVDSIAKKNKQTKQLVGLIMFLMIVIIAWLVIGNYINKEEETSEVQHLLYFSQPYPTSLEEFNSFVSSCENFLAGYKGIENTEEVLCSLKLENESNLYTPIFQPVIYYFNADQYISIAVNVSDLIKGIIPKQDDNICIISTPLHNPLFDKKSLEQYLIFPEAEIFCSQDFQLSTSYFVSFTGFVPKADVFSIEMYLVQKEAVPEILNQKSFSEAEKIIKSYHFIWQLKRLIYTI